MADEREALQAGLTARSLERQPLQDRTPTSAGMWPRDSRRPTWCWRRPTAPSASSTPPSSLTDAWPTGTAGSLTVWESTQGVYAVQSRVAEVLNLPLARVRVIGHYMGGGFGSKLEAGKYTVIAALMAKRAGRPVRLFLTREETFLAVGNRPPSNMTAEGRGQEETGPSRRWNSRSSARAAPTRRAGPRSWTGSSRDLYTCPNVRTSGTDVFINAGPARAFRAPGHPQGAWALEQMMDALAEAIGMDPVRAPVEEHPLLQPGPRGQPAVHDHRPSGNASNRGRPPSAGSRPAGTPARKARRRTSGGASAWPAACGLPAAAGRPSTVIVKLFPDGSVNLNMGASDLGTGTKTVMAMVVAEELGVKPGGHPDRERGYRHHPVRDSQRRQQDGAHGGPGRAQRCGAGQAEAAGDGGGGVERRCSRSSTTAAGEIVSRQDPSKRIAVQELDALKRQGGVVGIGYRGPNPKDKIVNPFAAQFCEVEVNTRTGEVKILRFLAAQDSGRVMNRLTYDNQVFGGITMGIGLAMTEMRILDAGQTGKMVNRNWHDYKLPTALDVPAEITCLPIEPVDTEANTTGAKGLGEPATIPTAAAIANAVYHATGLRMTDTPIHPLQLVPRLAERPKEG